LQPIRGEKVSAASQPGPPCLPTVFQGHSALPVGLKLHGKQVKRPSGPVEAFRDFEMLFRRRWKNPREYAAQPSSAMKGAVAKLPAWLVKRRP